MDKFFKISERGSSYRAEIVGGITTFFAMAYIIFVNPGLLSRQVWITTQSCWPPASLPPSAPHLPV